MYSSGCSTIYWVIRWIGLWAYESMRNTWSTEHTQWIKKEENSYKNRLARNINAKKKKSKKTIFKYHAVCISFSKSIPLSMCAPSPTWNANKHTYADAKRNKTKIKTWEKCHHNHLEPNRPTDKANMNNNRAQDGTYPVQIGNSANSEPVRVYGDRSEKKTYISNYFWIEFDSDCKRIPRNILLFLSHFCVFVLSPVTRFLRIRVRDCVWCVRGRLWDCVDCRL